MGAGAKSSQMHVNIALPSAPGAEAEADADFATKGGNYYANILRQRDGTHRAFTGHWQGTRRAFAGH